MSDRTYNLNGGFKPTMKRFADLDGPDFFPTPRWATFALADNESFDGDIWECACGDGAMSRVFEEIGSQVYSSDLYDRGYGEIGHDFLTPKRSADNIITNPPYNCAEGFVASGLTQSENLRSCCDLLSLKEQTAPTQFLPSRRRRAYGYLVSALRSTLEVSTPGAAAQRRMRGLFGIRPPPGSPNLNG